MSVSMSFFFLLLSILKQEQIDKSLTFSRVQIFFQSVFYILSYSDIVSSRTAHLWHSANQKTC